MSPRARGSASGCWSSIFVSNLPEAIGSSTYARGRDATGGDPSPPGDRHPDLHLGRTVVGYAVADNVSGNAKAAADGFAARALRGMWIDSMISEAVRKRGDLSGLVTVLGFAVAAGLSGLS